MSASCFRQMVAADGGRWEPLLWLPAALYTKHAIKLMIAATGEGCMRITFCRALYHHVQMQNSTDSPHLVFAPNAGEFSCQSAA